MPAPRRFFGEGGPFEQACAMYRARYSGCIPEHVLLYADHEAEGRLAFLLGYCFAAVLKMRGMHASQAEVMAVAKAKVTSVSPVFFLYGFIHDEIHPPEVHTPTRPT